VQKSVILFFIPITVKLNRVTLRTYFINHFGFLDAFEAKIFIKLISLLENNICQ
jgi:hypothetical protein